MADAVISEPRGMVEFRGPGDCYDTPSHIPFLYGKLRIKNIYCKHCMLTTITVGVCYSVKINKKQAQIISKEGSGREGECNTSK